MTHSYTVKYARTVAKFNLEVLENRLGLVFEIADHFIFVVLPSMARCYLIYLIPSFVSIVFDVKVCFINT